MCHGEVLYGHHEQHRQDNEMENQECHHTAVMACITSKSKQFPISVHVQSYITPEYADGAQEKEFASCPISTLLFFDTRDLWTCCRYYSCGIHNLPTSRRYYYRGAYIYWHLDIYMDISIFISSYLSSAILIHLTFYYRCHLKSISMQNFVSIL